MKENNLMIQNETNEIKTTIERYVKLYNSQNLNKQRNLNGVYFNECVEKPGVLGCYNKDNKWYLYYVDDYFNIMVNGPFSKNGIIFAFAAKLMLSSNVLDIEVDKEEVALFLQGAKPIEVFESKKL